MVTRLETQGLSKRYKDMLALSPTDLKVEEGEFLTLLGPSGSGKTTLLQVIAGLVQPTEGKLLINGVDATNSAAGDRGIGMVFQSYALFPHMTVWENVAYPLRMRKTSSSAMAKAVEETLQMVKMEAYAHRFPRELSGGQQQRIALARCFVYKPSVILLDEPLGALDKKLREHMQFEIKSLHKNSGATFIYVTHDQEEALTLSDRVCLMNQSRIEQIGTPQQMYDYPASRFVADFIGYSNLLEGTLHHDPDSANPVLRLADFSVPLMFKEGQTAVAPGKATLLIRPETAYLTTPAQGYLMGKVTEIVFSGSDFRVLVDIAGHPGFAVRCGRLHAPAVGEIVGICWNVDQTTVLTK